MIQEEYVSFETAKLLKEKGFDEPCSTTYAQHPAHEEPIIMWNDAATNSKGIFGAVFPYYASAPTQQMAMRWLREVYNLHVDSSIYIDTDGDSEHEYTYTYWDWLIFNSESGKRIAEPQIGCGRYDSYEEACEAAIKYCLENLIK